MDQDNICIASVVTSTAGRDRGGYFFVVGCEDRYVFLVNGKQRKVERPKKKKRRHVCYVGDMENRAAVKIKNGDRIVNSEIRRALAEFVAALPGI